MQQRLGELELTDGQIWGKLSDRTYDPFDLYERGVAPHLAFANAKDALQWHKDYGPLFGFTSAYSCSVHAFVGAQRRFGAVLNLWQAWKDKQKHIGEAFLEAVKEIGYVTLPRHPVVIGLNPEWDAETKGEDLPPQGVAIDDESARVTIGGRDPYKAAEDFAHSASRNELRTAAELLLKYALVSRLAGVQPDFSAASGFEATWTFRDFLQACYLMLFFDMTKRRAIRHCKECGQFFYATAKRALFCSTDCARRNRQRRYWKRRGRFVRQERRGGKTKRTLNGEAS